MIPNFLFGRFYFIPEYPIVEISKFVFCVGDRSNMSNMNYQQTDEVTNRLVKANFAGEQNNTLLRETAGSSGSAVNEPSGTGAIRKSHQGSVINKRKSFKSEGRRFINGEQTQSNWKPLQNHKKNYRTHNFSPNDEIVKFNHSDTFYGETIRKKESNYYTDRKYNYNSHDNMIAYSDFYEQNFNGGRNARHYVEYKPGGNFNESISIRTRKNKNNSGTLQVNSMSGSSENNSSHKNLRSLNEDTSNNSNAPKSNRISRYKRGIERNSQHNDYNTFQDNFDVPRSYRNGNYRNSNEQILKNCNGQISQDNSDASKYNEIRNRKNYSRISHFHQKNPRYINKEAKNNHGKKGNRKVEIASQRGRLEDMIKSRTLECLVCCELLKHNDQVWTCRQCYNILHLKCTQAWAKSSKVENGWRCPACQNVCEEIPEEYFCFCGKLRNPRNEPGHIAHSCGEICSRERRNCEHPCLILCHPGPCPECSILVDKSCGCGKTKQQVMCSSDIKILCESQCDKTLECNIHGCDDKCHMGNCEPCKHVLTQHCFCKKEDREVTCSLEFQGSRDYSCGGVCEKTLSCGNHKCQEICHSGTCKPCSTDCSLIRTCFCGKKLLEVPRTSCLDPIASCGLLCQKKFRCGPHNARHNCESVCHGGNCPPCDLTTVLKCRCGSMDIEIPCQRIEDDVRCERKCTKKRLCGKHKCNQRCCIEIEHFCPLPCKRSLSCGNHKCELTCHSGRCKSCMETSFDELYCQCGSKVIYPPIPCGTKPPVCDKPCSMPRDCGHDVNHTCHTGPCPPCTVLCKRWCYGNHEQRGTIPCHQEDFSCGLPCGKQMPCGRHKCISPCHLGMCPASCKQPCSTERSSCGHACGAPCHEAPCPQTTCRNKVSVSCLCGNLKGFRSCNEVTNEIRNMELALLNEKMLDMSKNQTVNINEISKPKRPDDLKILDCTEECRVIERNRRLAIGLQIRNPDISQKLTPRYSDFMRGWAKKDSVFCQKVHDKLTELVQLAKQSQQKCRSHSFESMNRDKRTFVHEYCQHFGCESAAYDAEPNRNIVATATKDKSWLPSMSLLEVIQRENGQRKVPLPSHLERNSCSKPESVALKPLSKSVRLNK